ncbi:hypothetical protein DSO57_1023213 [Entomophthora muscae]|uniref:Uncharacterized protein n=1 Tax=Entomophthora muscae TaxID=34485 RepID=A0ACC2SS52_9FUNG|nr:hypothetical protein DSO57_1023213 [Entomophthora muscae]
MRTSLAGKASLLYQSPAGLIKAQLLFAIRLRSPYFLMRLYSQTNDENLNILFKAENLQGAIGEVVQCFRQSLNSSKEKNPLCPSEGHGYDEILQVCRVKESRDPLLIKEEPRSFLTSRPIIYKEESKHDKFRAIISEQCDDNVTKQLNELARRTRQSLASVKVYGHLIHLYASQGDFLNAQKTFDLLIVAGLAPNEHIYNSLMNAYANSGKLKETLETFNQLQSDLINLTIYPYGILIKAYMKHNRVQDAFGIVDSMRRKIKPDTSIYNALIQACIKAHDSKRAWLAYDLMLKDDCQPSLPTYALLLPIAQKENLEKALLLFEEMLRRGMIPNLKIVNSLLSALISRPEYYSTSIKLLDLLITQKQFTPDVYTFNIMLTGAQLKRNLKDARHFFYKIVTNPSPPTQLKIAYCKLFQAYSLRFPFDKIERTPCPVDSRTTHFDFLLHPAPISIDDCVCEATRLIPSFERLLVDEDPVRFGRSWGSMLLVFANYNYFKEAIKYSDMIFANSSGPSHASNYKVMLEMCIRLGKREAFHAILEKTKAVLDPIGPGSALNPREKTEFKHTHQLSSESICNLYRKVVEGLAE